MHSSGRASRGHQGAFQPGLDTGRRGNAGRSPSSRSRCSPSRTSCPVASTNRSPGGARMISSSSCRSVSGPSSCTSSTTSHNRSSSGATYGRAQSRSQDQRDRERDRRHRRYGRPGRAELGDCARHGGTGALHGEHARGDQAQRSRRPGDDNSCHRGGKRGPCGEDQVRRGEDHP